MTEARKEQKRSYIKERASYLKERGMCVHCGSEVAQKGKVLCWSCAMYLSDYHKIFYAYRKDNNLCWRCGKPTNGETACPECKKINSANKMRLYNERKANHQCPKCGKQLADGYKGVLCPTCRIKGNEAKRISNINKKAA